MSEQTVPKLNKIPFLTAAVLVLGIAAYIASRTPIVNFPQVALCAGLGVIASSLAVLPFLVEYKSTVRFAESDKLNTTVAQIQNLESLAKQISSATAQWQDVQTTSGKTVAAAKEIAGQMEEELKDFTAFLQKANDSEKSAMRLEVEKMRRAEGEWLQVVVRILDHVFALHRAGVHSGSRELAEQLTHFQNACRDAARRIGVNAFIAAPDEAFDAKRHKLVNDQAADAGSLVAETLAPGFTYQSQQIRPALVKLKAAETSADTTAETAEPVSAAGSQSSEPSLL